jgi:predicted DNA binding CopG/RHH family protein
MRMKKIKAVEEIPERMTEEEAAEFYGSHDLAEVWDDLEPVEESFLPSPRMRESMVSLRLEPRFLKAVKELAKKKGLPYHALLRIWITERVRKEAPDLVR